MRCNGNIAVSTAIHVLDKVDICDSGGRLGFVSSLVIQSPGFNLPYKGDINCSLTIPVPAYHRLIVKVKHRFRIPRKGTQCYPSNYLLMKPSVTSPKKLCGGKRKNSVIYRFNPNRIHTNRSVQIKLLSTEEFTKNDTSFIGFSIECTG